MVFSIFHFFKALLINEGEATRGTNGIRGETTRYHCTGIYQPKFGIHFLFNAENTNFCIFHAYTYFVTADHE
jgi:hypothetical protein